MADFDPEFELNICLPLSQAAYDNANGLPLRLPDGFKKVADIVVDTVRMAAHVALATSSQRKVFHAMLLESTNANVFGLIAQSGTTVAVAFRGTETPEDWLKDFDFLHVPYQAVAGFGEVHQGFQFVYDSVRESVAFGLSKCAPRQQTFITGHSLGGALAVLCAPDIALNLPAGATPEVHTFAGPRTAAPDLDPLVSTFATKFDKTIQTCYRVVNRWDIVPHLPPSVSLYQHVGAGVGVDGGFTLDLARAHSLDLSYLPGLKQLLPHEVPAMHIAAVA